MSKPAQRSNVKTSVGGQAVMEGIMMRGPAKWCLAVRAPGGEVVTEVHELQKRPWTGWPFIRGVFNFVDSILMGYKTLMRSAELSMGEDGEEEQTAFDKWISRRFGDAGMKVATGLFTALGLVLAVGLFMFLPALMVSILSRLLAMPDILKALLEGLVKIVVFIAYLALVSRMNEIRRVFSYHGAEHKTIYCYEAGDPLTVENIRRHSRFHPRCGTSFIFLVLIVSIFLNSLLPWPQITGGALLRVGMKLLMLPVVMGLSYEVIRLAGRHDNALMRAVSAPGLWIQRLTTKEPDDAMIEVAIAAVAPVLPPSDAGTVGSGQ